MRFEDTGLKRDKLVEDAFNYAQKYNQSLAPEVLASLQDQLNASYEDQLLLLDDAKAAGKLDEEKYKATKARLDDALEKRKALLPTLVERQLSALFNLAKIAPALEVQQNSENSAPALVAASLLLDCVRDPVDYQNIDAAFGGAVSGIVAEVLHIESYPGSQDANIAAASKDAKRLMMAGLISGLNSLQSQLAKAPQGMTLRLPAKEEERLFHTAKLLWGNDKKQDARLVGVFNTALAAFGSQYKIEVGAKGPELVVGPAAQPKGPKKGPKGPTLSGDDGF